MVSKDLFMYWLGAVMPFSELLMNHICAVIWRHRAIKVNGLTPPQQLQYPMSYVQSATGCCNCPKWPQRNWNAISITGRHFPDNYIKLLDTFYWIICQIKSNVSYSMIANTLNGITNPCTKCNGGLAKLQLKLCAWVLACNIISSSEWLQWPIHISIDFDWQKRNMCFLINAEGVTSRV